MDDREGARERGQGSWRLRAVVVAATIGVALLALLVGDARQKAKALGASRLWVEDAGLHPFFATPTIALACRLVVGVTRDGADLDALPKHFREAVRDFPVEADLGTSSGPLRYAVSFEEAGDGWHPLVWRRTDAVIVGPDLRPTGETMPSYGLCGPEGLVLEPPGRAMQTYPGALGGLFASNPLPYGVVPLLTEAVLLVPEGSRRPKRLRVQGDLPEPRLGTLRVDVTEPIPPAAP